MLEVLKWITYLEWLALGAYGFYKEWSRSKRLDAAIADIEAELRQSTDGGTGT